MSWLSTIFGHPCPDKLDFSDASKSLERLRKLSEELDIKERNTRLHEEMLFNVANDIDIAIWGKGIDGKFVFMNTACAEEILHTTIEEGIGMADDDFKENAMSEIRIASDKLVLETRKTHRFIEYSKYKDGYLFLDTKKSPWIVDGELIGTVGFGRDLSQFVPEEVRSQIKNAGNIEIPLASLYNSTELINLLLKTGDTNETNTARK